MKKFSIVIMTLFSLNTYAQNCPIDSLDRNILSIENLGLINSDLGNSFAGYKILLIKFSGLSDNVYGYSMLIDDSLKKYQLKVEKKDSILQSLSHNLDDNLSLKFIPKQTNQERYYLYQCDDVLDWHTKEVLIFYNPLKNIRIEFTFLGNSIEKVLKANPKNALLSNLYYLLKNKFLEEGINWNKVQ